MKNQNKTKQKKKKGKRKINREEGGVLPPPDPLPPSASVQSLVIIVLLLLAVGQRGAGADLPVAVQPLLHHLSDERVVAAAGAFLQCHQNAAFCHAAVQPLSKELLLLLFVSHLKGRSES